MNEVAKFEKTDNILNDVRVKTPNICFWIYSRLIGQTSLQ